MKKKETNKNNLIEFLIVLTIVLIFIMPLISAQDLTSSEEENTVKIIDGNIDLHGISGELTIEETENIDTLEFANGIIPNIKSGKVIIKEGIPTKGKLFFSDDSSFDLNGQHITVPKDGYIEFKDGKIIVSKNSVIEMEGTKIQAMIDETEIKIEKDIVEVKGKVSVDYTLSPAKIILSGKNSLLELQTEDKEKFEFRNLGNKELIVNIGSFHKSEDCIEKNCISYQDMGIGVSGEEWDKLKIDGNAIITKYYDEERIYQIKFEDGKAKLRRDSLSRIANIDFDKNTIINYNDGDIKFSIDRSKESSQRITIRTVDKSNVEIGILTIPEYFQEKIEELQKKISSWRDGEKEDVLMIIEESKEITVEVKDNEYITLLELAERYAIDYKKVALYLALWEKEANWREWGEGSKWGPHVVNEWGFIGIGQLKAPAFKDVIDWYPEAFSEYVAYRDNDDYLTEVLKKDIEINAKVSAYYFELQEIKYAFGKLEYQLTGYNAGPTVTKDMLYAFEKTGKTSWEDYKAFLRSKEGGLKFISSDKAEEVIDYIETICTDIGHALV